jgi:hypothetical protein
VLSDTIKNYIDKKLEKLKKIWTKKNSKLFFSFKASKKRKVTYQISVLKIQIWPKRKTDLDPRIRILLNRIHNTGVLTRRGRYGTSRRLGLGTPHSRPKEMRRSIWWGVISWEGYSPVYRNLNNIGVVLLLNWSKVKLYLCQVASGA